MLLRTAVAFGLFISSAVAGAAEWRFVDYTNDAITLIDVATIERSGSGARAWQNHVYRPGHPKGWGNAKELNEYDCSGRTMKFVSQAIYLPSGSVKSSYTAPSYVEKAEPVIPETIGESSLAIVCADVEEHRSGHMLERSPEEAGRIFFALAPYKLRSEIRIGLSSYVRETDPEFFDGLLDRVPQAQRAAVKTIAR